MTVEVGTTAKVRELNQEVILSALRNVESASIADIAKQVDLSVATCVKIVGGLVESGEIEEIGERDSRGGRPARHYRFNPDHSLIAALILRATREKEYIVYYIADANGNLIHSGKEDAESLDSATIDNLLGILKQQYPTLKAVSLSIPGTVTDGVIGAADAPGLIGLRIEEHIRIKHNLIVSVENDMNFAALGYYRCHVSDSHQDIAYLLFPLGGPVGGGLVINGGLVRGKSGFAGELSYVSPCSQREKLQLLLSSPNPGKKYIEYAARIVATVTAMFNPSLIVLSGDSMAEELKKEILAACATDVPLEHLPELVIQQDYSDDCLTGMIVQALSSLARYPHLLQFSPVTQRHY